jgi:hypothetical protein
MRLPLHQRRFRRAGRLRGMTRQKNARPQIGAGI